MGDDDVSDDDDDDDACVKIMLVTPLRSAAVIPSSGNQDGSSTTPVAEVSNPRDSRGKGIMADDAAARSVGVNRPRPSSGPVPSFRDVFEDAIHTDFLPFSDGPYFPPTLKVVLLRIASLLARSGMLLSTLREMVRVESLSDDQLTAKMSVLHCMMISHGGELLARYRGLNQSHHEYVLSADSRLKGYKEKIAILTGLELQVSTLKKQVFRLNDKLTSSDASFAKSKAKEAKKDEQILHLKATPPEVQGELLSLAASAGFEHGLSMHRTKDEFAAVLKKMANFMPANVPTSRDACVFPLIAKESTMTPASKSLELSTNIAPAPSVVALEQNEEWVNAMVDGPDAEMTDGAAPSKSRGVFVQGISHVLDDVAEVMAVGSERVSSCPTDVIMALSVGEKGDGSLLSSPVDEEASPNPFGV
ncbi:hypothetical protein Tco_0060690 [Tanacetum coccineum]